MKQRVPNAKFTHLTQREIVALKLDDEYEVAQQRRLRASQVALDKSLNPENTERPNRRRIE